MKLKRSDGNFAYFCPNCKRTLAFGKILAMSVICPDCSKLLNYDLENKELQNSVPVTSSDYGGIVLTKEYIAKTYGRDKLTIDRMYSTKEEAIAVGHSHYFTGKPCRNGHLVPRSKRGECNQCVRNYVGNFLKKRKNSL